MSCQPSLSKSRKAQPVPSVSGKYFFPKAPLLCLKCIPACAETSVNSIGPEGRGGVGLTDGEGVWAATSEGGALTGVADCLHAENKSNITSSEQQIVGRIIKPFPWICRGPKLDVNEGRAGASPPSRPARLLV